MPSATANSRRAGSETKRSSLTLRTLPVSVTPFARITNHAPAALRGEGGGLRHVTKRTPSPRHGCIGCTGIWNTSNRGARAALGRLNDEEWLAVRLVAGEV